jgi:hypothetical protein
MTTVQEFRDLPNPIDTFERLFRAALNALLPDLAESPWYVREREVVNLFVFGHLIPQFQTENLDLGQLGIEVPVMKLPKPTEAKCGNPEESEISQIDIGVPVPQAAKQLKEKPCKNADIVVWPHTKATVWRTCKPLVHIEWKNISCREKNPHVLQRQHEDDILLLERSQRLVSVSYAVLTDQQDKHVSLRCVRIKDGVTQKDFFSAPKLPATYPESASADLKHGYPELLSRLQACPQCEQPARGNSYFEWHVRAIPNLLVRT